MNVKLLIYDKIFASEFCLTNSNCYFLINDNVNNPYNIITSLYCAGYLHLSSWKITITEILYFMGQTSHANILS